MRAAPIGLACLFVAGCDCSEPQPLACVTQSDCADGEICRDRRCVPRDQEDAGPDAGADAAEPCPPPRVCGDACCSPDESCVAPDECCATADVCGSVCCGAADHLCIADVCVLDCGATVACGQGAASVCCAVDDVCLLGVCVTPGDPCEGPFDCPEGEFCDGTIGRCLPRATDQPECEYRPDPADFELAVEWHWVNDPDVMPLHDQVMSAPMVANLTDDDGDGAIDEHDIPDVVFNTFRTRSPDTGGAPVYTADGVLRAISGLDGSRLWPIEAPAYSTNPGLEVAIADIDAASPGPEIVGCTFDAGTTYGTACLTIFSATGDILRRFDAGVVVGCGRPAIADMNGDGIAEIAVGNRLVQSDGSGVVDAAITGGSAIPALYDMDGDLDLELVGINGVAQDDGSTLWTDELWTGESGYVAVADVNLDGVPDVVATSTVSHQVTVRDGMTGDLLGGPVEITPLEDPVIAARVEEVRAAAPERDPLTGGGPPTIANFDDDPEPEFALAGGYAYVVFENDATLKWYEVTQDTSSRATGSSVFDFEGDGVAEVLYNDEYVFRAFRGPTGDLYLELCNTSGTLTEYPIVVDVDNDDHAEVLVVENNYSRNTCEDGSASSTGVWAFGHPRGQWVRTRRIWNEHSYHVTNVEEDGTLPAVELPNFSTPGLNNFRQNVQPDGLFDAPDLVLTDPSFSTSACPAALLLRVRVVNEGRAGAPAGVPVSFWVDGVFAGQVSTAHALFPGASEVVELRFGPVVSDTLYSFEAVLNDPDHDPLVGLNECRTDNNGAGPVTAVCPGMI